MRRQRERGRGICGCDSGGRGGGEEGEAYGWEGLTQYMCLLLSLTASFCVPPLLRTALLDFYGQRESERKRERVNKRGIERK